MPKAYQPGAGFAYLITFTRLKSRRCPVFSVFPNPPLKVALRPLNLTYV
jgi:hypothetical protein